MNIVAPTTPQVGSVTAKLGIAERTIQGFFGAGTLAWVILLFFVSVLACCGAGDQAETANESKLLRLAQEHFKNDFQPISALESNLFRQTVRRSKGDFPVEGDRLNKSISKGSFHVMRANRIEWLCSDRSAKELVSEAGISVSGIKIVGDLNLDWVDVKFPVRICKSIIGGELNLRFSRFGALDLSGSVISNRIHAERMRVDNHVSCCDGFRAQQGLDLEQSWIGGNLNCEGGFFDGKTNINALTAFGATINGYIYLTGDSETPFHFESHGRVSLMKATVGLGIDCRGGTFSASDSNDEGAIRMTDMTVHGYVIFGYGFKAIGGVMLAGSEIDDYFSNIDGLISNPSGGALDLSGAKIGRAVYLSGTNCGQVRLAYARIGGGLISHGRFESTNGPAFDARFVRIDGNVSLDTSLGAGVCSLGEFNFDGAEIGGDWDVNEATFSRGLGLKAFSAHGATVGGHIHIKSCKIDGTMSFREAKIGSDFFWESTNTEGELDFALAETKALSLGSVKSWPRNLDLDGFVYDRITGLGGQEAADMIDWIRRQPRGEFHPQPYEQLAEALRKAGDSSDSKEVLIAKNDDRYWRTLPGSIHPLWLIYRVCVRYGYEPWWALLYSIAFIAIGSIIFYSAWRADIIRPTDPQKAYYYDAEANRTLADDYVPFGTFIFSLEMFVPLLQLDMGKSWVVSGNGRGPLYICGRKLPWPTVTRNSVRFYLYLHIILGWVLTSLWVVALTGLAKG